MSTLLTPGVVVCVDDAPLAELHTPHPAAPIASPEDERAWLSHAWRMQAVGHRLNGRSVHAVRYRHGNASTLAHVNLATRRLYGPAAVELAERGRADLRLCGLDAVSVPDDAKADVFRERLAENWREVWCSAAPDAPPDHFGSASGSWAPAKYLRDALRSVGIHSTVDRHEVAHELRRIADMDQPGRRWDAWHRAAARTLGDMLITSATDSADEVQEAARMLMMVDETSHMLGHLERALKRLTDLERRLGRL